MGGKQAPANFDIEEINTLINADFPASKMKLWDTF